LDGLGELEDDRHQASVVNLRPEMHRKLVGRGPVVSNLSAIRSETLATRAIEQLIRGAARGWKKRFRDEHQPTGIQ